MVRPCSFTIKQATTVQGGGNRYVGPCLAVMLNDRLDYFGQTVNIAARIQGLAVSRAIFASKPVVDYPQSSALLQNAGIAPAPAERGAQGRRGRSAGL